MATRVPLIVDTSTLYIKELPVGDSLDLSGSGLTQITAIGATTGNFSGIVTASSFYVDSNVVLTNGRELSNIASVDATTKATLESALQTGPNNFDYLNVTGVSTLASSGGITTTGGDFYAGGDVNFTGELYQNGTLFSSGVGIQSGGTAIGAGVTTLNFIGVGNTFLYDQSNNTIDISISGGGAEETTSVSSTSATSVLSFAHASYRSASVLAQISQGSNYQVGRYLLIHDGTTVTVVEESSVATGSMLGSFTGAISGSNLEFRVTMSSASSATVVVKADKISA
jgi:hypothetical protein